VMPYREQKYKFEPIGYHIKMTDLERGLMFVSERLAIPKTNPDEAKLSWAQQGELAAESVLAMLFDSYL
jgi:hypothetical protein